MITLSTTLAGVKYARAYFDCDGRLVGVPLTKEQESELAPCVGKRFRVVLEEEAPGVAEVGI
jgi:hypothetical protein